MFRHPLCDYFMRTVRPKMSLTWDMFGPNKEPPFHPGFLFLYKGGRMVAALLIVAGLVVIAGMWCMCRAASKADNITEEWNKNWVGQKFDKERKDETD